MLSKIVVIFLVVMAVLAMFGRLRVPKVPRLGPSKCPECGRYRIGKGPCPCRKVGSS